MMTVLEKISVEDSDWICHRSLRNSQRLEDMKTGPGPRGPERTVTETKKQWLVRAGDGKRNLGYQPKDRQFS